MSFVNPEATKSSLLMKPIVTTTRPLLVKAQRPVVKPVHIKNIRSYLFISCVVLFLSKATASGYENADVKQLKKLKARGLLVEEVPTDIIFAPQCLDRYNSPVGAKGNQTITPRNSFAGLIFQRKNGDSCPCSFVEVKCEIGHKDCSSYEVNGVEAALKGYPDVDITYTFKFCNYNDMGTDINLVPPPQSLGGLQTYNAELYSTKPGTRRKEFMFQQSFDQTLGQGVCEEISSTATVNTSRSKLFQKAVLQGPQMSEGSKVVGGYCFAYAFNMIDFKYDYGLGECKVHTETSCTLTDGSGKSCEDHINFLKVTNDHTPFEATFEAKACNDNGRDIQLQVGASNYKISTYEVKGSGKYKRDTVSLPDQLLAGRCATFRTTKEVDPCKPNFWSIGIQGSIYNPKAQNAWVFKDKECNTYKMVNLPIIDPESEFVEIETDAPTAAPTMGGKGKGKSSNRKPDPVRRRNRV